MQAKIVIVRGETEHYYSFLPALQVQLIQMLQQPILLQINLTCFSVILYAGEEVWSFNTCHRNKIFEWCTDYPCIVGAWALEPVRQIRHLPDQ